jgi:hypothetical protein
MKHFQYVVETFHKLYYMHQIKINNFHINLETFHTFKCFHGSFGRKTIVYYFLLFEEITSAFQNYLEIVNGFRDSDFMSYCTEKLNLIIGLLQKMQGEGKYSRCNKRHQTIPSHTQGIIFFFHV